MKRMLIAAVVILTAITAKADNFRDMEPLKLDVPEMKAELVAPADLSLLKETSTEASQPHDSAFTPASGTFHHQPHHL